MATTIQTQISCPQFRTYGPHGLCGNCGNVQVDHFEAIEHVKMRHLEDFFPRNFAAFLRGEAEHAVDARIDNRHKDSFVWINQHVDAFCNVVAETLIFESRGQHGPTFQIEAAVRFPSVKLMHESGSYSLGRYNDVRVAGYLAGGALRGFQLDH